MTRPASAVRCMCIGILLGITVSCDGGDDDVCRSAFAKLKDCYGASDCAVADAKEAAACRFVKSVYAGTPNYDEFLKICELANPGQCGCDGKNKTENEAIVNCALDKRTCNCGSWPQ